jgi:leucine dehydrogenase
MTAPWDFSDFDAHEGIHFFTDDRTGLNAIIAIHSTNLGPAGGGVRFWPYTDGSAAITDALRLSRGMSYKNAMAGLSMGGGKGVIIAPSDRVKPRALVEAFGRGIESLGGRYITAQDVGISLDDMVTISGVTRHVAGLPPDPGMAGGNPGPATAHGVFLAVEATAKRALKATDLKGVHVAIQGVGSVGGGLAHHLHNAGARLTIADLNKQIAEALALRLGAECVSADAITSVEADIFSPCALGAIFSEQSIPTLKVKAIAGGANNQLAKREDGQRLVDRGILYAPDYVVNAGGIINVALQYTDQARAEDVTAKLREIPVRLNAIWDECDVSGAPPASVADAMARKLIGRG